MKAFKCDICGAYYDPYAFYGNQDCMEANGIIFRNKNAAQIEAYTEFMDVCPECMNCLRETMVKRGWTEDKNNG